MDGLGLEISVGTDSKSTALRANNPTSRQNFANASGMVCARKLTVCLTALASVL